MSATEWWLLAAIIAAGLSAVGRLVEPREPNAAFYSPALLAIAVGLIALALLLALP